MVGMQLKPVSATEWSPIPVLTRPDVEQCCLDVEQLCCSTIICYHCTHNIQAELEKVAINILLPFEHSL